ncbi:MAG: DUF488 family protein [Nanoarchaeota archaeon]|nr:DUF488 family protein [Nanoarchaeota archaeon]
MSITTSYFAVSKRLNGTKISIARFHLPFVRNSMDEVISSFAPSPDLLSDYKEEEITWGEYSRRYRNEQRKHYRDSPEDFHDLLKRSKRKSLVLLCYEKHEGPKTKCHRLILYDILQKVDEAEGTDVRFVDEVPYSRE